MKLADFGPDGLRGEDFRSVAPQDSFPVADDFRPGSGLAYRGFAIRIGGEIDARVQAESIQYVHSIDLWAEALLVMPDGSPAERDGEPLGVLVHVQGVADKELEFLNDHQVRVTIGDKDQALLFQRLALVCSANEVMLGAIVLPDPSWGGEAFDEDAEYVEHNARTLVAAEPIHLKPAEIADLLSRVR